MLKPGILIKFSKLYLIGLSLIALLALSSIYFSKLNPLLFLIVVLYGFYCAWSMRTFRSIQFLGENRWILYSKNHSYIGHVCGDSTVTSYICILRFKLSGHYFKKTCVILRDSVSKDEYRALLLELYACRKFAY